MHNIEFEDSIKSQIGFLIKRVQQGLRGKMDEALSQHGLTTSQYAVLSHLREATYLSNAELARLSFVSAPTMIRIVQELERIGFIDRTENKVHRKAVDITISPEGARVLNQCDSIVQGIQQQMLSGFTKDDITNFAGLLISCAEKLEAAA
ncbi:MarR family winged helix-turn-helix transcriptional regulator [Methylophilus medardicus]|uniref:MarR family transcriptional regulator n=1 Tax=Methylophilus medardicus TaxID=2588534 RepID=A0A5B8CTG4_9PROT|nr:MarR family transcriptional regulator [Methylophilus medardicus]QDC44597.1 MarR family transcriptional regulator [Methylophilus medardicus]QDC49604.1 MarR family transcriptional regulator [Methylophilus medardicus]QDC53309.1 MarR family transcriptional regulator [Methylophilus medardicus]